MMKIKKSPGNNLKFDRSPIIRERTACRINAMIEVLELPVAPLTGELNSVTIGNKLMEITGEEILYQTVEAQSVQLQFALLRICPDEEPIQRILELAEKKLIKWSGNRE